VPAGDKKGFFGTLYALIEKSQDVQLLRAITRMVAHWIKSGPAHEATAGKERDMAIMIPPLDDDSDDHHDIRPTHEGGEDLMLLEDEPSGPRQAAAAVTATATATATATTPTLTLKEKCNFLLRMTRFDKIADAPLQAAFLDLVLQVRSSRALACLIIITTTTTTTTTIGCLDPVGVGVVHARCSWCYVCSFPY
jgi:hypothetical protein